MKLAICGISFPPGTPVEEQLRIAKGHRHIGRKGDKQGAMLRMGLEIGDNLGRFAPVRDPEQV